MRAPSTKVQKLTPEVREYKSTRTDTKAARQERERAAEHTERMRLRERRAAVVQELREQVLSLLALLMQSTNTDARSASCASSSRHDVPAAQQLRSRTRSLLVLLV